MVDRLRHLAVVALHKLHARDDDAPLKLGRRLCENGHLRLAGELGEKLRALLLSEPMNLETEALLMFAARREHIAEVIQPALERGSWVVSDRFTDASFAYQGGGRGLAWAKLEQLEKWVQGDLQPDLTFLFDLDVATAQQRLANTGNAPDRFEQQQQAFFERVRSAYHRRVDAYPDRFCVIDAKQSVAIIQKILEERILSV